MSKPQNPYIEYLRSKGLLDDFESFRITWTQNQRKEINRRYYLRVEKEKRKIMRGNS